ncbi:hypothetical protein Tco_0329266 [Tanacetum coccineum]
MHFANRFESPSGPCIDIDCHLFKKLSSEQDILKHDFVNAIREFFISSKFPPGCNSSFIALIPKKHDAKFVKDYRPISLIGCFYQETYLRIWLIVPLKGWFGFQFIPWNCILKEPSCRKGINLLCAFEKERGNGCERLSFGNIVGLMDVHLADLISQPPWRGGREQASPSVELVGLYLYLSSNDRWAWLRMIEGKAS